MTNVLLVTTVSPDADDLEARLRTLIDSEANVRIVAPATDVSVLEWLTNDEDAARRTARAAAAEAADAVETSSVEVDATSHDTDAAQAVVDALRSFAADEIVVVTRPDETSTWLEDASFDAAVKAAGVPVRRVVLSEGD